MAIPTKDTALGVTMRDRITGFTGVCTAFCSYFTGCDQVALQPVANEKGEVPDPRWFDVARVEATAAERIVLGAAAEAPGADPTVLRAAGMHR